MFTLSLRLTTAVVITLTTSTTLAAAQVMSALKPQLSAPDGWTAEQTKVAHDVVRSLSSGARTIVSPGATPDAIADFSASASIISRARNYPVLDVAAYDHLTRCMLVARLDLTGPLPSQVQGRWKTLASADLSRGDTVPSIAVDGAHSIAAFSADSGLEDASRCQGDAAAAYGERLGVDKVALSKLAQHAEIVLRGGAIGSAEAPVEAAAIRQTALSRIGASEAIVRPHFLGSIRTDDYIVILIGDPRRGTRWAAQYRNLGPARWRFEGASALGLSLFR